jgi:hypothetical protein
MNKIKWIVFWFYSFLSFHGYAGDAPRDLYFHNYMNYFYQRPSHAMNSKIPKFLTSGELAFEFKKVSDQQKALFREKFLRKVAPFAMWDQRNRPESFFDPGFQIERNVLRLPFDNDLMEVPVKPWSGDYWATFKGGVASRYNDPDYPQSWDFMENYKAYQEFSKIDFSDPVKISNLSPSEKYDILVGDENFSLTRWSFESAHQTYLENNNEIEPWFGICHGWAPASYKMPTPGKTLTFPIKNFKGQDFDLRIYSDDLKALGSLLWANAQFRNFFLGGRCNAKEPKADENGRVVDPECFDLNPATWHLAALHQIGQKGDGFVFDANFDYEVWNQPIIRLKWSYFNPESLKESLKVDGSLIPIEAFKKDLFKKYRHASTKKIVGVKMQVSYATESTPHHEFDDLNEENVRDVVYIYDLELTEAGEIIGGEWYQNDHPDFMWTPVSGVKAWSPADYKLQGDWLSDALPPASWRKEAQRASLRGLPVGPVVDKLFQFSQE